MRKIYGVLAAFALMAATPVEAATSPPVPMKLWRLDCGKMLFKDLAEVTDTFDPALVGKSKELIDSCYLIKHGDTYMLWDTGLPVEMIEKPLDLPTTRFAVTESIVSQLAKIGVKPAQISIVAISHMHADHTGQALFFPKAKLLLGKGDLDQLTTRTPDPVANVMMRDTVHLKPWLEDGAPSEGVVGDKDIFGDGSVIMLNAPGHTAGHHVLLVRMPKSGPYLMTGDLIHISEQVGTTRLSARNVSRAETLASFQRIYEIVENLKVTMIIQHEPADVGKLPRFPQFAD
jgi:N-acyl homoserine lactone hydrolase